MMMPIGKVFLVRNLDFLIWECNFGARSIFFLIPDNFAWILFRIRADPRNTVSLKVFRAIGHGPGMQIPIVSSRFGTRIS